MDTLSFRKASFCSTSACVEFAESGGMVMLRDSKSSKTPVHSFDHDDWRGFLVRAKRGDYDYPSSEPDVH